MLHFENDYNKGIHPQLLQALVDSNQESFTGYGMDSYCAQAAEKIKEACHCLKLKSSFYQVAHRLIKWLSIAC